MKIAYIITLADHYGGAQIHVRDMSSWVKSNGHIPIVLAGTYGKIARDIQRNGIPFYHINGLNRPIHPLNDIRAFINLRRTLKEHRPDIVSCHSSKAGIIGRLAAWSLGLPVIFTAHGWSFSNGISWRKKFVFRALERLCARFCDHIITVCHFDRSLALEQKIIDSRRISTIHNGMPYLPPLQGKPQNATPQIVMVARFSRQKDHKTLLQALALIKDKAWHLNLIGAGDDMPYRVMSRDFGIADKITFHGERADVPQFIQTQDIFLLISHWEGFSRSIIEAMRASLPVIASNTAGTPESVSQGQTGYIVPEKCPRILAAAISALLAAPHRQERMGYFGRKRFEKHFTFDMMAIKTMAIYQNVLETRHAKPPVRQEQIHRTDGLPLSLPPSDLI